LACRGVLFALTDEQENKILSAADRGDEKVRAAVQEIEDAWDEDHLAELQLLWDALHRCLSDGTTDFEGGTYPLNRAILGGKRLYHGDDYIVAFVPKTEVPDVAAALVVITDSWMRERFFALPRTDFPQMYVNEEWFEYTLDFLEATQEFYQRAARDGLSVIFTVDQ
jgi:hypothetical protein